MAMVNNAEQRSARGIFSQAIEKTGSEERAAYLDSVCGGDALLRWRVEELLAQHFAQDSFMQDPAVRAETVEMNVPLAEGPGSRSHAGSWSSTEARSGRKRRSRVAAGWSSSFPPNVGATLP